MTGQVERYTGHTRHMRSLLTTIEQTAQAGSDSNVAGEPRALWVAWVGALRPSHLQLWGLKC